MMTSNPEPVAAAQAPEAVPIAVALERAVAWVREQKLAPADELLARILEAAPDHPDALHYQGMLRHAQGRSDESIALIGRSLSLQPAQSGAWNNLGNLLIEAGRSDDARLAYDNSVSCAAAGDEGADALSNIAALERQKGNWSAAEHASRRAIELRPAFSQAWYNLSIALMEQGRIHESVIANSRAVVLQPRNLTARSQVIRALKLLGEHQQAAGMYREWLAEEPGNPVVAHLLAACEHGSCRRAPATAMSKPCSTAMPAASTSASKGCTTAPLNWWRARWRKSSVRRRRDWPWSTPAAAPAFAALCCGPGRPAWPAATCRSACCSAPTVAAATTCCTRPNSLAT